MKSNMQKAIIEAITEEFESNSKEKDMNRQKD